MSDQNNAGTGNIGAGNYGDHNVGNHNAGDFNYGDFNIGNRNAGDRNIGNWNHGNNNLGHHNFGSWNKGDYNTGLFNTQEQNDFKILNNLCSFRMFNKPFSHKDWDAADKPKWICFTLYGWLIRNDITNREEWDKMVCEYQEAAKRSWDKASDEDKLKIYKLPNFDAKVAQEIFGIDFEAYLESIKPILYNTGRILSAAEHKLLSLITVEHGQKVILNFNFRGYNLEGADCSNIVFIDCQFAYANLTDVDFRCSSLRGADFTGANLSGADFTFADLTGAIGLPIFK
jgi:hypothetical protein